MLLVKFVFQMLSEQDKNHGINNGGADTVGERLIYESGDKMCPVKTFEVHISHLRWNNHCCNDHWRNLIQNPKFGTIEHLWVKSHLET